MELFPLFTSQDFDFGNKIGSSFPVFTQSNA